ncbi:MAG: Cell division protein FtsL [Candidatus Woesebacteria bacterium GW2011_GWB1_43_14]|uniref:Cell division protein FtsL n=1 Tax=Candidatus Woesebacteria bacterium GW2011_GWB1_43_14 TaxID=1618578 RepID=A0A0G1DMS4_9BACT|nr:MAG: Cell division protein FtsL [Candidatus Woesebacteria bacterium GW2011_GWC1_42_9]KKS98872.1 MAG: Cell division protein FtsL [Candidatus Woesebacteria bacterium GW2011_GWB1_43_14]
MGIKDKLPKHRLIRYLVAAILLVLSLSLARNVMRLYRINRAIDDAYSALEELDKKNRDLADQIKFVRSEDYIEKQARDKLGLAKEGEIVVVLPDSETLRKLSPRIERELENEIPLQNWQKWLKLF